MDIFSPKDCPEIIIFLSGEDLYYMNTDFLSAPFKLRLTKRKKIYFSGKQKHIALKDPLKSLLEKYYSMFVKKSEKLNYLKPEQFLTSSHTEIRNLVKEWMQTHS